MMFIDFNEFNSPLYNDRTSALAAYGKYLFLYAIDHGNEHLSDVASSSDSDFMFIDLENCIMERVCTPLLGGRLELGCEPIKPETSWKTRSKI